MVSRFFWRCQLISAKILERDLNRTEVRLNYQVDQKTSDLLVLIINHINGGYIGHRSKNDTFYFGTTSFSRAYNVIQYFDTFNILSSKHLSYLLWREAYFLIANKEHLLPSGIDKIKKLKDSINSNLRIENANWLN